MQLIVYKELVMSVNGPISNEQQWSSGLGVIAVVGGLHHLPGLCIVFEYQFSAFLDKKHDLVFGRHKKHTLPFAEANS